MSALVRIHEICHTPCNGLFRCACDRQAYKVAFRGSRSFTGQYLGLKVDTVYKKARLREVPSVKVGRALRFDVKALERFIEQHTIETIDN